MKYETLKTVSPGFVQHAIVIVAPGHVGEMVRRFKPELIRRIE